MTPLWKSWLIEKEEEKSKKKEVEWYICPHCGVDLRNDDTDEKHRDHPHPRGFELG
jgi:hypothetical protein